MSAYAVAMPPQDFDLFGTSSGDQYADLLATSQAFAMPNVFFDSPFTGAMAAIDPSAGGSTAGQASLQPPMMQPRDFISTTQAMHIKHGYSPAASPPLHPFQGMAPLPVSSADVVASAHSTSNSTLGSPALHSQHQAQYQEPWGLGLPHGVMPQHQHQHQQQQPFATSALEQDLDKQAGFVGESATVPTSSSLQSLRLVSAASPLQSVPFPPSWSRHGAASADGHSSSASSQASTSPLTASHSPLEEALRSPAPQRVGPHAQWLPDRPLVHPYAPDGHALPRRASSLSNQVWPPQQQSPQAFVPSQSEQLVTSPFFNQSSGRFIPPLESSCRFSSSFFCLFSATRYGRILMSRHSG